MKREITATLLITQGRNFPYFRISVLGPRSRASAGELEVPVRITFDDAWLRQRTPRIEFDIPTPATPVITSNEG